MSKKTFHQTTEQIFWECSCNQNPTFPEHYIITRVSGVVAETAVGPDSAKIHLTDKCSMKGKGGRLIKT